MNITQLEKVLKCLDEIELLLDEDRGGSTAPRQLLSNLKTEVRLELKNEVYKLYQRERDQQ